MLMATFTKGNEWMTRQMDLVSTCIRMEPSTSGTGKKTSSKGKGWKYGRTVRLIKGLM